MKIEMKFQISGTRDGIDWPAPGETIDVPTAEAEELIAQRVAVEASTAGSDKPAKIDDILAEVVDDPAKAAEALEVEKAAAKPRTSLVEKLEAIVAG